jgi:sulfhydrogenase subunit beta (sulfur reductase)
MKFITQQEVENWLEALSGEQQLYAPIEEDGVLLYKPVTRLEEIVWDFIRPVKSIKEIIFPQTEHLMTFEKHGEEINLTSTFSVEPTVIFGVRSCDARGALVLDKVLVESKPEEPYYRARREQTALIGVACQKMGESCFCTSMGGSPDDSTGMDIMLHEVEGGYLVEVVSEKGQGLITNLDLQETELSVVPFAAVPEFRVPDEEIWRSSFQSPIWSDAADRCLSCRVCAYVCPTCRCFDVRDEKLPSHNHHEYSERVRCWDSCSGEVYRRIAGGHNPREAKADRLRNRVYCKLFYIKEQSGELACTGCGRCIESCPVNIDITEIMTQLMEGVPA